MDSEAVERLERIARNMPAKAMNFGRVETPYGLVYLAVGRGPSENFPPIGWHGVYATSYGDMKGIGRLAEFNSSLSMREAQQKLLEDALWMLGKFHDRDLLDRSFRLNA